MKRNFLLIFFIFFISEAFSQISYKEGFIITQSKDTVYGSIANRLVKKNYYSCVFKNNGRVQTYSPDEIAGYGFLNDKFYSSNIINGQFVEVLVLGSISLFRSFNEFLLKKDGEIYKLTDQESTIVINGEKRVQENTQWRGIITYLVNDCLNKINMQSMRFTEKYITHKVVDYNKCSQTDYIIFKQDKKWATADIGIIGGFEKSFINLTTPEDQYLYLNNSYTSIDPYFGIYLDIYSPRITERLALQPSVELRKVSYHGEVEYTRSYVLHYEDTYIDLTTLSLPINVKYLITNNENYNVFIQSGMTFDIHIQKSTKLITEKIINDLSYTTESNVFNINDNHLGFTATMGISRSFKNFSTGLILKYVRLTDLTSSIYINDNPERIGFSLIFTKR